MGKPPKLDAINKQFEMGKDFKLTDAQYEQNTGVPLPKEKYYILHKSALSRVAYKYGFEIEVIEKQVLFHKKGDRK